MKKKSLAGIIPVLFVLTMGLVACSNDTSSSSPIVFSNPGTYTATVPGHMNLPVTVESEFSARRIESVRVTNRTQTAAFALIPVERIPAEMIRYQTLDVDVVVGATLTSLAIINAVWDAAEQAGANFDFLVSRPGGRPNLTPRILETEVLVVGSGISGLFAAFEAARSGADVILIEKLGLFGGTTATNGGIIQGVNNPVLRAQGFTDSADAYFEFLESLSLGRANVAMLRHVADSSQAMIEQVIRMGVKFDFTRHLEPLPANSPYRKVFDLPSGDSRHPSRALWANRMGALEGTRSGDGSFITIPIVNYLRDEMGIRMYSDMEALSLIQPVPGGRVTGVNARDRSGATVTINSDSVILATGGFHDNPTLMAEFHPMLVLAGRDATMLTLAGADGDGIEMGRAAGAAVLKTNTPIAAIGAIPHFGVWVTPSGVRYHDEAFLYPMAVTGALFDLGYHFQWAIMNDTHRPTALTASPAGTSNDTPGVVFTHNTIEGLAELIGLDPVVLRQTITDYDAQVTADAAFGDDDFGLRTLEHKSKFAVIPTTRHQPIGDIGPFWAQRSGRFGGTFAGTRGGLRIDIDGRVIHTNGSPILGLFAAGEVANAETLPILYGGSGMALNVYATMAKRAGRVAATGSW